jgi:NitT/TauT family transport system substrate-binding protein/putative hydroxymethylpyrimidine transport system substrate-binding protein
MVNRLPRVHRLLPALLACALLAAGCGSSNSSSSPGVKTVNVALDFVPNAVHAPLYEAVRTGADRKHGIKINIVEPGSSPDSLKALLTGRADVGVLDIQDLGIAQLKGRDVVGIAALVQRPLGALVSQPSVTRPRDLEGKTVGVSGLPSDPAFVSAIVRHDGGNPSKVHEVTIGFEAVKALLAKRVASVPAFWNAEGVTLKREGLPVREFKIDDYGAPPWPEVVLAATRKTLDGDRDTLQRFVSAVQDGARAELSDPGTAAQDIAKASDTKDLGLVRAQLAAVRPILDPTLRLNRSVLERWAAFGDQIGLLDGRPDVCKTFDFTLAR